MDRWNNKAQYINLDALPSQTTVDFWIIVITILGIFVAGAIGFSPIPIWPITFSIFVLPILAFLAWPNKELAQQDLTQTKLLKETGVWARIQAEIRELAIQVGYQESIRLVISQRPFEVRAFGSWRRHYILLGSELAVKLANDLAHEENRKLAQVLLLHEIAHFAHRDVQRIAYIRQLLRSTSVLTLWWTIFSIGWAVTSWKGLHLLLNFDPTQLPDVDPILQPILMRFDEFLATRQVELAQAAKTFSLSNILFFIVYSLGYILSSNFLLWLVYWRRMIRVQEFYADQFVLRYVSHVGTVVRAFGRYSYWMSTPQLLEPKRFAVIRQQVKHLWQFLDELFFSLSQRLYVFSIKTGKQIRYWLRVHPTIQERIYCLQQPEKIFKEWRGVAGSIVALILITNYAFTSPFANYHLPIQFQYQFISVGVFILLSTHLLPFIIMQWPVKVHFFKILSFILGFHFLNAFLDRFFLILTAVFAPNMANVMVETWILAVARVNFEGVSALDSSTVPLVDLLINTLPIYILSQFLLIPGTIFLLLWIYYRFQTMVVCQNLQARSSINWRRVHWFIILAISVSVMMLLVNPISSLTLGDWNFFTFSKILSYGLGLAAIATLLGWYRQFVLQAKDS